MCQKTQNDTSACCWATLGVSTIVSLITLFIQNIDKLLITVPPPKIAVAEDPPWPAADPPEISVPDRSLGSAVPVFPSSTPIPTPAITQKPSDVPPPEAITITPPPPPPQQSDPKRQPNTNPRPFVRVVPTPLPKQLSKVQRKAQHDLREIAEKKEKLKKKERKAMQRYMAKAH